jgi:hypothetical protein
MADAIAGAVKSDAVRPPDPAGASLLADAIRNISTEKRTEVGATPELAPAISGKTFNFPANALNVKSFSLTFSEQGARFDQESYARDPGQPPVRSSGPIGLDGLYRKGEITAPGQAARKGNWLNGSTFVIDRLIIGAGEEAQKWTLSFDGAKLHLRGKNRDGRDVLIDGELGG